MAVVTLSLWVVLNINAGGSNKSRTSERYGSAGNLLTDLLKRLTDRLSFSLPLFSTHSPSSTGRCICRGWRRYIGSSRPGNIPADPLDGNR